MDHTYAQSSHSAVKRTLSLDSSPDTTQTSKKIILESCTVPAPCSEVSPKQTEAPSSPKTSSVEKLCCSKCDLALLTKRGLSRHTKRKHGNEATKFKVSLVSCNLCNLRYFNLIILN